jgi:hypothetical protein
MTLTHEEYHSDTQNNASTTNIHHNKCILSLQDLVILHASHIFPQNSKDYFKAYKHLHGIDMQKHSIPKSPKQKAQDMGLSDLHDEEFKIFAMEYNTASSEPNNKLDHFVNTLQQSNEDNNTGINDMFLNNLDPTCYAMQMQNPDVLTHAQMKRQLEANKNSAQRLEIGGLMDINAFEFIPKTNLPGKTRYLDLICTYRRKRRPDGSLKKKSMTMREWQETNTRYRLHRIIRTRGPMEHYTHGEHTSHNAQPQREINQLRTSFHSSQTQRRHLSTFPSRF